MIPDFGPDGPTFRDVLDQFGRTSVRGKILFVVLLPFVIPIIVILLTVGFAARLFNKACGRTK